MTMYLETMKFLSAVCFSILAFAAISQAQVCQPAPVSLVSWWSADGNSLDSRSRNNGALQNGATFAVGHVGQAFSFDGANDWVRVNNAAPFYPGTGSFTIDAWVKSSDPNGVIAATFENSGSSSGNSLYSFVLAGGLLGAQIRDTDGGGPDVAGTHEIFGSTNIADNDFNHVALVRNMTTGTLELYLDGGLHASEPLNAGSNGAIQDDDGEIDPLGIGATPDTGNTASTFLTGLIDEVEYFNRALSPAEIAAIHAAGTAGKCKPTATAAPGGQVAWWSGDGNTNDIAGTNNGTLQDGAGFAVGRVGQSFSFDGGNDSVQVPSTAINFGTGDFTIDLWFNQNSVSALGQSLFGKTIGSFPNDQTYLLETYDGNLLRFLVRGTTANENDFNLTVSLPANTWHHVVAVRQGNINRLYLNGLQIGQQTAGSNVDTGTGGTAFIGRLPEVSTRFFNGRIDEPSLYNRALTQEEITSIFNAGIAGKLKTVNTPTGFSDVEIGRRGDAGNKDVATSAVPVSPRLSVAASQFAAEEVNITVGDATISFPTVTTAGTTQQTPIDASLLPPFIPSAYTGLMYDIATSSIFTGSPTVCFNLPSFTAPQFINLRVYHLENGAWVNRTAASNAFPTLCTESLASLSPFAIVQVAPTAASVSVGGRVLTANGGGISKLRVSLTDPDGSVRTALTNPFGYYRFDDVQAGETYIVSVQSKRYQFSNPTQVVTVLDELSNVDFTASP